MSRSEEFAQGRDGDRGDLASMYKLFGLPEPEEFKSLKPITTEVKRIDWPNAESDDK